MFCEFTYSTFSDPGVKTKMKYTTVASQEAAKVARTQTTTRVARKQAKVAPQAVVVSLHPEPHGQESCSFSRFQQVPVVFSSGPHRFL